MCPDTQPRRARLTADFRGDRGETGGRVDPVTLEVITPVKPTFPQNWGKGPGAGTNRREPGPRRRSSGRGCGREPPGCKSGKLAGYSANWRNCRGATTATGREGQGPGEAEGVSPWPGWASTRPIDAAEMRIENKVTPVGREWPVVCGASEAKVAAAAVSTEGARDCVRSPCTRRGRPRSATESAPSAPPAWAIGDDDHPLRRGGDDLLAQQRAAAALDEAEIAVDLIGAIDGKIELAASHRGSKAGCPGFGLAGAWPRRSGRR